MKGLPLTAPPGWTPPPKTAPDPPAAKPMPRLGLPVQRSAAAPPLVQEWGYLCVWREIEPHTGKPTILAYIGLTPNPAERMAALQAESPRQIVCVGIYESDRAPAFAERFIENFKSSALGRGWHVWTKRLQDACYQPPRAARALAVSHATRQELDAIGGVDPETRAAGPLWRVR